MTEPVFFTAARRSDRRKKPETQRYRYMEFSELVKRPYHVHATDQAGRIVDLKITSVKTWKTRPEAEIHWKYGLYEFGIETIYPDRPQRFFCAPVYKSFKATTGRDPIPGKDYDPDNLCQDDYEFYTGTGEYKD